MVILKQDTSLPPASTDSTPSWMAQQEAALDQHQKLMREVAKARRGARKASLAAMAFDETVDVRPGMKVATASSDSAAETDGSDTSETTDAELGRRPRRHRAGKVIH